MKFIFSFLNSKLLELTNIIPIPYLCVLSIFKLFSVISLQKKVKCCLHNALYLYITFIENEVPIYMSYIFSLLFPLFPLGHFLKLSCHIWSVVVFWAFFFFFLCFAFVFHDLVTLKTSTHVPYKISLAFCMCNVSLQLGW